MRIIDCVQRTPQWLRARAGIPTASQFDRILTPKKLERSKSQDPYLAELVAEHFMGTSLDEGLTAWMQRGTELEDEAINYYAMVKDLPPERLHRVGFIKHDKLEVGGSPDGLIGRPGAWEGGLEIKIPSAKIHAEWLLGLRDSNEHRGQIQGNLFVSGLPWWDLLIYNPVLPSLIVRHEPDREYLAVLEQELPAFMARLAEAIAKVQGLGGRRMPAPVERAVVEERPAAFVEGDVSWEDLRSLVNGQ